MKNFIFKFMNSARIKKPIAYIINSYIIFIYFYFKDQ